MIPTAMLAFAALKTSAEEKVDRIHGEMNTSEK